MTERVWQPTDCLKGVEGCFCRTGYAYEDMCPECRDLPGRIHNSFCVCEPRPKAYPSEAEP